MPTPTLRSSSNRKVDTSLDEFSNNNLSGNLNTRSRHRKISVKQKLKIYNIDDLKNLDQDELTQRDFVENIETGVEKNEEKEIHLFKILQNNKNHVINNGNNKSVKDYIPTPSTQKNWNEFNSFYHGNFIEPRSYIKFSATVDDCCGVMYNMDEMDYDFLENTINKNLMTNNDKINDKDNDNDKDQRKDRDKNDHAKTVNDKKIKKENVDTDINDVKNETNNKQINDLKKQNDKISPLTEDEFEILCTIFENAIQERQPFLNMDPNSILTFADLKPTLLTIDFNNSKLKSALSSELNYSKHKSFITQFDSLQDGQNRSVDTLLEIFGSKIYEYWKQRKISASGTNIFPQLKFEKPGEKEEEDPYVCFRRREVRHPRKTRRIDVINSHKLRLLYRELQHTKDLALLIAKRELKTTLINENDMKIFNGRCKLKKLKRSLNNVDDNINDLLIDHKRRRPNIITLEERRRLLELEEARENALLAEAATAKRNARQRLNKKQAEQNNFEKASKQQLQNQQANNNNQQHPSGVSNGLTNNKYEHRGRNSQNIKQNKDQKPLPSISSHVYVKLPSCKIPEIVLDDVDNILAHQEKNARKFVQERMEKRKLEDGDNFFNLTDDPYNPVFDISLPQNLEQSDTLFSSITSSKFEIDRSYFLSNLNDYLRGNTNDISLFNEKGEKINSENDSKLKKTEMYNTFETKKEILSREFPVKFRKRIGRCGIQYLDRKPNFASSEVNNGNEHSILSEFLDFDAIEKETVQNITPINVYDSKVDELTRLHDRWKYDSPKNEYGVKFSSEPARLNQISNETQTIRFGTMLGTKSYEQLRKATLKYRRDYINKLKQMKTKTQQQMQIMDNNTNHTLATPNTTTTNDNNNNNNFNNGRQQSMGPDNALKTSKTKQEISNS